MDAFKDEFLPNLAGASAYDKWKQANSGPNGDYTKWVKFRDAVLAGSKPTPPTMATKNGRFLVAAGKLRMSVTDIGSVPPAGTPPAGNVFVTQGGSDTAGNGSQGSPYRTLRKACTVAVAGDVISMGPGSYVENIICTVPPKVSVTGAGGRSSTTVITGTADPLIRLSNNNASDNAQTISGIKLDGQNRTVGTHGMEILTCRNVTLDDVFITSFRGWTGGGAAHLNGVTSCTVKNSIFQDSGLIQLPDTSWGSLGIGNALNCVFHDVSTHDTDAVGVKGIGGYLTTCEFYNMNCTSTWTGVFPDWDICAEFFDMDAVGVLWHHSYFGSNFSVTDPGAGTGLALGQYRYELYNNFFDIKHQGADAPVGTSIEMDMFNMHIHHNYFKGGAQALSAVAGNTKNPSHTRIHHNVHHPSERDAYQIARIDSGFFDWEWYNNTYVSDQGTPIAFFQTNVSSGPNVHDNIFTATAGIGDRWGNVTTTQVTTNAFYNATSKGTSPLALGTQPLPLTGGFPAAYVATGPAAAYGAMGAGTFVVGPQ